MVLKCVLAYTAGLEYCSVFLRVVASPGIFVDADATACSVVEGNYYVYYIGGSGIRTYTF